MEFKVREIEVRYKGASNFPIVTRSQDVAKIALSNFGHSIEIVEEFKVILVGANNRIKGIATISQGGLNQTIVDIRYLFSIALKGLATSIIVVHNHPSGNLKPSQADKNITQKIKEAGELLDIPLLDHIIITKSAGYYSFSDHLIL